ncbi:MAG: flagellar biosynthetic protein FliR [Planctomycetota bacterium]
MDLTSILPFAVSLFLHVARVGGFFAVTPLFGRQADSAILRVVLSVAVGAITWWVGDMTVRPPGHLLALAVMVLREVVIGLALGFLVAAIMSLVTITGEIISSEMGFSMAQVLNPDTGTSTTVVAQLLQILAVLLVFHLDLHHEALRIVGQTFVACPVGKPFAIDPLWHGIAAVVGGTVALAVHYALPVMGVMMLLSTGTVLIGRAVPSINMMEFAFALRVLVALGVLGFYLVEGAPYLAGAIQNLLGRAAEVFGG